MIWESLTLWSPVRAVSAGYRTGDAWVPGAETAVPEMVGFCQCWKARVPSEPARAPALAAAMRSAWERWRVGGFMRWRGMMAREEDLETVEA